MVRTLKLEVKSRRELEAIKRALAEPDVRAFVEIVGYLKPLTPAGRHRVLAFVADSVARP